LQITGSITALATPFAASGGVDFTAWRRLLQSQLAAGTQGLVVAGSTGEAAALDPDEFRELLSIAVAEVAGAVPVLAGTGGSNTARTVQQTRLAASLGASAALVVTPPYVRPTQEGLRRHYLEVAEHGDVPVVLYNVPPRTGCDLLPATVAALAGHARIVAIKEAVAEPGRMAALVALRAEGFAVLGGDDPTACRAMLAGADGCISVASNVVPRAFRRMCDSARAGRSGDACALDAELAPVFDFLGVEPNPIPAKALLAALGWCEDALRLPLLPLSEGPRARLADMVDAVRRLEASVAAAA
jgi:4-hydroxy-tetrahydrodipicolinate synthase